MKGPRPKPRALRILGGNAGHRPVNHREPVLEAVTPEPPAHLSAGAREIWPELTAQLEAMGTLTTADQTALAALAEAYAARIWATRDIEENGWTTTLVTTSGSEKEVPRPAVAVLADADRRVLRWAEQFGLTSVSRVRVRAAQPVTPTNPFRELGGAPTPPRRGRSA